MITFEKRCTVRNPIVLSIPSIPRALSDQIIVKHYESNGLIDDLISAPFVGAGAGAIAVAIAISNATVNESKNLNSRHTIPYRAYPNSLTIRTIRRNDCAQSIIAI